MANVIGGSVVWNLDVASKNLEAGLASAKTAVERTAKDIDKSVKGLGDSMKDVGGALTTAVSAPIGILAGTAFAFTKLGGQYSSVQDAFKSMTKDMNIDAKEFQKNVAAATGGQIDNLTILQNATKGLALIGEDAFNDFGTDFVKMAELSKKAARATGQDVDFMFTSLVTGIARESKPILDNLGISLDVTEAKKQYALSLGKTTEQLTQSEEKHAVLTATLGQLEGIYGDVAVSAGGFSGAWQQLTTEVTNAQIAIGQELEPTLSELVKSLTAIGKEIMPVVINVLKSVIGWFNGLSDNTKKFILIGVGLLAILGPILVIFGTLIGAVATIAGVISGPLILAFAAIAGAVILGIKLWKELGVFIDIAKRVVQSTVDAIKGKAREAWDTISNIVGDLRNAFGNLFNAGFNAISDLAKGIVDGAKSKLNSAVDTAKGMLNKLNPFNRESPSLVDNVLSGVKAINKAYSNIDIPTYSPSVGGFSAGVDGYEGGRTVNINNQITMQRPSDVDAFSRRLSFEAQTI